jgi:hypothetical protein
MEVKILKHGKSWILNGKNDPHCPDCNNINVAWQIGNFYENSYPEVLGASIYYTCEVCKCEYYVTRRNNE